MTFTVVVWDGGSPTMTSNATVNVTVLDTNDNRPVISPGVYFSKLPSDAKQGIGFHPLFSSYSYSYSSGSYSLLFHMG